MKSVLQPWQLLFLILAGWINRHQQEVLEYLRIENLCPSAESFDHTRSYRDANCERLAKRLDKYSQELFTFLLHPDVPADNNPVYAARGISVIVVLRENETGKRGPYLQNSKSLGKPEGPIMNFEDTAPSRLA